MDIGSAGHVRSKLKHDAKTVLRHLQETYAEAVPDLSRTSSRKRRRFTLTACKKLVATKYYNDPRDAFSVLDYLDQFAAYNYSTNVWSREFDKKWRLSVHKRQVAAIKKAEATGASLKECADEFSVNFCGFHFSYFLYVDVFPGVVSMQNFSHPKLIDFSGLSANGCFIEQTWLGVISSFSNSNFKKAKFYTEERDGIRPGANIYCMDFSGADMSGADLRFSYLRGCKFTNVRLEGTDFRDSNLLNCCFDGAEGSYKSTGDGERGDEYRRYVREVFQRFT